MDATDLAIARNQVRNQIVDCRACPLGERSRGPVPFRGPVPNRVLIVGEAPGRTEERVGRPFIGASGKALSEAMRDVGLDLDTFTIANSVCCNPHEAPNKESLNACHPNLVAVVNLVQPEWVVLLGAVALSTTGFRIKVSEHHGRHFFAQAGVYRDRWCFPTYHPAAGLRDPKRMTDLKADLSTLRDRLRATVTDVQRTAMRIGRNGKPFVGG